MAKNVCKPRHWLARGGSPALLKSRHEALDHPTPHVRGAGTPHVRGGGKSSVRAGLLCGHKTLYNFGNRNEVETKMSSEISPAQMEIYRKSAREHEERVRTRIDARFQHAWEIARQAAAILKRDFGVTRVVVFGSLLHPELFHLRSDIDLAVWDVQHYFRTVAHLMDLDPEIDFDLVPIEDARPAIKAVIEREGMEL